MKMRDGKAAQREMLMVAANAVVWWCETFAQQIDERGDGVVLSCDFGISRMLRCRGAQRTYCMIVRPWNDDCPYSHHEPLVNHDRTVPAACANTPSSADSRRILPKIVSLVWYVLAQPQVLIASWTSLPMSLPLSVCDAPAECPRGAAAIELLPNLFS